MYDKIEYITDEKTSYPLACTNNVVEKIQLKYGSMQGLFEKMDLGNGEPNYAALNFLILECINEGIDIENCQKAEKREQLTAKQAGRLITKIGYEEVILKILKVVTDSMPKPKDETKNETPTQSRSL
jgi:predicted transcriptional regulator